MIGLCALGSRIPDNYSPGGMVWRRRTTVGASVPTGILECCSWVIEPEPSAGRRHCRRVCRRKRRWRRSCGRHCRRTSATRLTLPNSQRFCMAVRPEIVVRKRRRPRISGRGPIDGRMLCNLRSVQGENDGLMSDRTPDGDRDQAHELKRLKFQTRTSLEDDFSLNL